MCIRDRARDRTLTDDQLEGQIPEAVRDGTKQDIHNMSDEEAQSKRDAAVKNNEKLTNDRLEQIEQMKAGDANNYFTNNLQALLANPTQDHAEVLARQLMRHKREYDTDDPVKRRANMQQYMTTSDKERLYSNDDSLWNVLINATDRRGQPLVDVEALIAEENDIKKKHEEAAELLEGEERQKYDNSKLGFELALIFWHFLGALWIYLFLFIKYFS